MKILWFEVTTPSHYTNQNMVIGGWQDSLERIVRTCNDIELYIAFESAYPQERKNVDGVKYIPIYLDYTKEEQKRKNKTWEVNAQKLIPAMKKIVEEIQPSLIQVFGTEWPFGLIAAHTDIPVVVHIQGAMAPYNNALFPPGYNFFNVLQEIGWTKLSKLSKAWNNYQFDLSRSVIDENVWHVVPNYMGRTDWDKALSSVMHPGRTYFHVEEALRPQFTTGKITWSIPSPQQKLKLISTGCSNFWKGPDMMIKTAALLTKLGIDFEWNVAGYMPNDIRRIVEKKEKLSFKDNHINILGYIAPEELLNYLCNSTLYVHTAYVENSPNSICEAQCIGIPIVSTNVGGISTLVRHEETGLLVPANDPWQMAAAIISLSHDRKKMEEFSERGKNIAMKRHDDEHIKTQLLEVYQTLTKNKA